MAAGRERRRACKKQAVREVMKIFNIKFGTPKPEQQITKKIKCSMCNTRFTAEWAPREYFVSITCPGCGRELNTDGTEHSDYDLD